MLSLVFFVDALFRLFRRKYDRIMVKLSQESGDETVGS